MAKALGIGGIFFKSDDPKKLAAWYQEWLNMPLQDYGGVHFTPDQMPSKSYTVFAPFPATTDYFDPSKREFMFNLIVDDLEEALAQVTQGGAQIVGEIEDYDYGRFGWFLDPEGNKVELWQPL